MDIAAKLIGCELSALERLCEDYAVSRELLIANIFQSLEQCLEEVGDVSGNSLGEKLDELIYNRLGISLWVSKCQERLSELRLQFDSLIGVQRGIWASCGADPEAVPLSGHLGNAEVRKCRIFDGPGMNLIADAIIEISSRPLPKMRCEKLVFSIPDSLAGQIGTRLPDEKPRDVCAAWLGRILLYCHTGLISCENAGIAQDIDNLRGKSASLLKSLRELHINLERLAGRVEAAGKELSEANSPCAVWEE